MRICAATGVGEQQVIQGDEVTRDRVRRTLAQAASHLGFRHGEPRSRIRVVG
jgi:hypothetical protein